MENDVKAKEEEASRKNFVIVTIIMSALFLAAIIYGMIHDYLYDGYGDLNFITVRSLSAEELEAAGYTTNADLDDADIWQSESDNGTTVGAQETSEEARITVVFPLDVNFASVDELVMVRGIGEVTAKRIVDYRSINGYFYSMDELLNVEGIGEKKLAALNGYLFIDNDVLPETLPQTQNYDIIEAAAVTTAPAESVPETETAAAMTEYIEDEEDFFMETEAFITDKDTYEWDTEEWQFDADDLFDTTTTSFDDYFPDFPLELNSATEKDLTYIKGIGEVIAAKIVEYAKTVGFTKVEDLLNVNGIGQAKFEMILPYVYVDPSTVKDTVSSDTETDIDANTETDIDPDTDMSIPSVSNDDNDDTSEITLSEPVTDDTLPEIYRVNINTCGKEDLMQLPGIDESLANEILELRNKIKYFEKIEELSFALTNEQLAKIWNYIYV